MSKTVKLTMPKCMKHRSFAADRWWKQSPPFIVNPRGILVHRIRSVSEICCQNKLSHFAVHYWCGNQTNVEPGLIVESLFSDPPKQRLLCEHCERMARQKREKSADQLAGRHVHTGRLRAFQTCCQSNHN